MLTCRLDAAPTSAPKRIRLSRSDQGVCQRPRIQSKPLQCRGSCSPAHPCHHTHTRRRDRYEAHGAPQLGLVQRQRRSATTTWRPAATVEFGVYDRAHLPQSITRKRPEPGRPERAARPLRAQEHTADERCSSSRLEPRAAIPRGIASA
jgi:hypothetical protein